MQTPNKQLIIQALYEALHTKEVEYQTQIESIRTELANDSKSSAGDKYETSREMAQQEIEQLSKRLAEVRRQMNLLKSLPTTEISEKIQVGSLIHTNQGIYLLGIPFGALKLNETTIYAIGSTAPIAQLLLNKTVGDQFLQSGKTLTIETIC